MKWCHGRLSLLVRIVTVWWPQLSCAAKEISSWTLQSCMMPSNPENYPVASHHLDTLDLGKLSQVAKNFWLSFSGTIVNMDDYSLKSGVLYSVNRNKTFAFQKENDHVLPYNLPSNLVTLDRGSFGFVSCQKTREKAKEELLEWWQDVPLSYIAKVLIAVGVIVAVVVGLGCGAVGVVVRKRASGRAQII
ncbi:uncharacterized protein LOC121876854 [Homarus americanus]|uniref:uncharacterized protein LOC121876854 n=1 Tax=Homarus americanus TaxID=6706 RepID=UPI001C451A1F|nr:uncharacterized protein LOC121876854 [Homarus americanus]